MLLSFRSQNKQIKVSLRPSVGLNFCQPEKKYYYQLITELTIDILQDMVKCLRYRRQTITIVQLNLKLNLLKSNNE